MNLDGEVLQFIAYVTKEVIISERKTDALGDVSGQTDWDIGDDLAGQTSLWREGALS